MLIFINANTIVNIVDVYSRLHHPKQATIHMWHCADHLVIQVDHSQGSTAIFRQFCDNALQTHCVQSASSYFRMLHC